MGLLVASSFAAALAAMAPLRVQADDFLRGPHPFLKENELSVHGGYAVGFGDTFSGIKAMADYGYQLAGSLWLDVGLGFLSGACRPRATEEGCGLRSGNAAEVLAGIKWKLQMNVPVVPYAKLSGGLAFLFPDEARDAAGLLARGGVGAKYFFYDWFGLGPEITFAVGYAGYGDAFLARRLIAVDLGLGVELQF